MPTPTSPGLAVDVGGARPHLRDPDRMRLADVARGVLRAEGIGHAEVSIAVVDDRTIRDVNRRHLDHDWPTDVISFVLSDPGDEALSGEVVVSAETAARTAARDGVTMWTELLLYVVHGLLHLCGHDDLTEEGAAAMRRREGELLAAEGLAHPFSPVAMASPRPALESEAMAPAEEASPWRS